MKCLKCLFFLLLVLSLGVTPNIAAKKKKKSTCGATSIAADDCPKVGCGADGELTKRKNLVTPASSPEEYTRSSKRLG